MKSLTYLSLILFLMSCGPSEGNYYEHLMTEERIKIDKIGKCGELGDYYEERNEWVKKTYSDRSEDELFFLGRIKYAVGRTNETDKDKECFAYETDNTYTLEILSKLKEDYRRIK